MKNRASYAIIIVISLILVYFTKQWLNSQKAMMKAQEPIQKTEYVFDGSTYVDPYGITTCYPSDVERWKREQAKKGKNAGETASSSKGKYHYHITLSNAHREWDNYDKEVNADGSVRMRKRSSDLSYLNGTYEWDMDLYLSNDDAILSYIIENYNTLKKYKVKPTSNRNIYDEYNDNLDAYLDDPEDEITFDPDIYDFLDD